MINIKTTTKRSLSEQTRPCFYFLKYGLLIESVENYFIKIILYFRVRYAYVEQMFFKAITGEKVIFVHFQRTLFFYTYQLQNDKN